MDQSKHPTERKEKQKIKIHFPSSSPQILIEAALAAALSAKLPSLPSLMTPALLDL